jgi:beta-ketoacyl-acyl-carrier-protein synthase II
MIRPRVVITGLGTVNPLGNSVTTFWEALINGKSGIGKITRFDASELPCQIAGEVRDLNPTDYLDRKTARRLPRATILAIAATSQAIQDAGFPHSLPDPERTGVLFGTAIAGFEHILSADQKVKSAGYSRLNPFKVPSAIPNMPAAQIAIEFQCLGPNNTTATACAAGTQAVGEGAELIRRGVADVVITGGTDAIVEEVVISAFSVMRAIPFNYNDRPHLASRPFDINRAGFVLSEGSAALVIESLDHAKARGAKIYAEVIGHASSSDGYHIAAIKPDGLGPTRAMRWALEDADLQPDNVDYINAHGTSTSLNDAIETLAIKKVFGDHARSLAISSTKSMIGHSMGAAGALEAIATTLTIYNNLIPPTINYTDPDPDCDLFYTPNEALRKNVDVALSNSFGLGGQNACLALKAYKG